MQITHKTMAALVAVFLALLAGAAVILDRAVRPGFERLEALDHERNQARVAANVAALAQDVRARVADYAQWDDTYAFVVGRKPSYTGDLTDEWFEDYGLDIAVFADTSGRVLWSRMRNPAGDEFIAAPEAATLVDAAHASRAAREPRHGVLWVEGLGFVMVATRQATRSDGGGVPRGWVVFGRRISPQGLGEQTQLQVETPRVGSAPQVLGPRLAALADQPSQTWIEHNAILSLSALHDFDGRVVGAVLTRQDRDATALGARSVGVALALFCVMLTLGVAVLLLLLRALVIRPIEQLERHFDAQAGTPQEMQLRPGAQDEIARLTAAYNGLVARARDASARERAANLHREAETAANRMKSDFLANVSHELRRPLDSIIGYAELIHEELSAAERARVGKDVDRILDSARRLLSLIGEILDLSRIDAGRLDVRPDVFNVDEMVQSAAAVVAPLAQAHGVEIEVQGENLGEIYADQKRLHQCVVNVLSNACRLSPGAHVVLRVRRYGSPNGEMMRFEISDNGQGLTASQLAQAFEPFAVTAPEMTRRLGVAGLTLAVTHRLIALLGGVIEAHSTPGRGSLFALVVPVSAGGDAGFADASLHAA